jgi:hypothetical protein
MSTGNCLIMTPPLCFVSTRDNRLFYFGRAAALFFGPVRAMYDYANP